MPRKADNTPLTHSAVSEHIKEFLNSGGVIQQIPRGVSATPAAAQCIHLGCTRVAVGTKGGRCLVHQVPGAHQT